MKDSNYANNFANSQTVLKDSDLKCSGYDELFLLSLGVSPGSSTLQNLFEIPELTKCSTEPSLFHASQWDKTSWVRTKLNTWNSKLLLNLVSKTETQQNLAILLRGRKPQGLRSSIAHDDCHRENKMLGTVSSFNRTPWSESTEVSSLTSADYIYTTKLVVLQ